MNKTAPHKNSPLILVVDDDKFMRIQLRRAMEQAGYQVAEARDGQQGLAAYTRLHPDIVLLDALMPVMDGFTCCSLLHKLPEGERTPVLMITALEDQESVDRAFEAGAIDYITKPIHWAVLRQRVRSLLQTSRATEELRQQIERTQASEERLRLALDAAHLYTWDWDILSGKVVYSVTTEANLGLAPGTFDGTYESFLRSVHPEDLELLTQAVHNAVENKADLDIEFRVIWSDGSIHWAASKGQVYYDQTGKAVRMLGINMDITEKKQLQRQFLRAQRMESIGTLASGIAHDLNNVLAPIMMSVQLLAENNHNEQSQWLLPILETNIQRAADLVKQVLTFARGLEGARTTLQIRHLISEIKHIVKETFPKSIEFRTALETLDLWAVRGDATQLHQVLMNLVVNARDAMPNGGFLSISAENFYIDENYARMHLDAKVGSYVVITVADTGTGIPPEILDRIFEPFFTTKEFGKGTGLGLSTVIGIVKGHGGFVNVYSEVGKGTQFKVYLPAVLSSETQQVSDLELPTGHGELILVVDDEAAIREVTKTSLETYAYRVLTASDGIEAVALYVQHKEEISVALIDMMMPVMDGSTTIRTLQKINPQVKIIAVSGLASGDRVAEVARIGVKTFLSKPYTTEQLLKTLQGVLIST